MKWFMARLCSVIFAVLVAQPGQVSAVSITDISAALGLACTADGANSTAMGRWSTACGIVSIAMGYWTTALGHYSIAMGDHTTANGLGSTTMGYYTTADADYSTIIGTGWDSSYRLINNIQKSFMVGYMKAEDDTAPEFFVKDGAVGFGTTTPTEQITIATPSNTDTKILFTEVTAPAVSLFYEGSAGAGTNNLFHIRSEISGSERNIMTWKLDGYVGIGKTAPGQKLDIAEGNGRVETGYSWLTNSDSRLKKNVSTLEGALEKISHIRGVRFDIKSAESIKMGDGKHIGVIAQELEKEYPELVVGDEKTGYKAVAYDKLTAVLIEAVKELKSQNERQKAEIEELRSMIEELKS